MRELILNAFCPNIEVFDPSIFSGRKAEIIRLSDSLLKEGSCPIIYGHKGVGKSSLARQLARIALGDCELLHNLQSSDSLLEEFQRFKVFYVTCTDTVKSKDDILRRIMNEAKIFELPEETQISKQSTTKIKLKLIEREIKKEFRSNYQNNGIDYNIEDEFISFSDKLAYRTDKKLLFIIDEIDRVCDTKGFSAFLKKVSNNYIKFVLVGVSHSISSLISDHESIQMKIDPVHLDIMNNIELSSIIDKVVDRLCEQGICVKFDEGSKEYIVNLADGFPWFIHAVGQEALLEAYSQKRLTVYQFDAEVATRRMLEGKLAEQFNELYLMAVSSSKNREIFLRLLAKDRHENISLKVIYRLSKKLKVSDPYRCKRQLMTDRYGEIIVTPSIHKSQTVKFKNELFKRYVKLCDSFHREVKLNVDAKWTEQFYPERI